MLCDCPYCMLKEHKIKSPQEQLLTEDFVDSTFTPTRKTSSYYPTTSDTSYGAPHSYNEQDEEAYIESLRLGYGIS